MTRVVTRTRCTKHTRRFRLPSAAGAEGLEPPAYGFGEGRPRMQLRTEAGFPPRFHPLRCCDVRGGRYQGRYQIRAKSRAEGYRPTMVDVVKARAEGWSDDDIVRALRELEGLTENEARRRLDNPEAVVDDVTGVAGPAHGIAVEHP
jgi:hypothetical protein